MTDGVGCTCGWPLDRCSLKYSRDNICGKLEFERNQMEVDLRDGKVDESIRRDLNAKMVRVEEHVARMMVQLDPTGQRSSTDKTPYRVARMFITELCSGYYVDIEELFQAVYPSEGAEGLVVVHDIPLYSMCEHHWLMITGKAHVGYIPNGQVLGLSKVARVVDAYARRFQLQERLTMQIANAIDEHLEPRGVMVVLEAEHHCLSIRGAQKPGTITTTSEARGLFEDRTSGYQDEFWRLAGRR